MSSILDMSIEAEARARQSVLTKPPGSLGRLEDLACWLAGRLKNVTPEMPRCEVFVFAADHGVAARGVSAYPQSVTAQMVQNFVSGGAAVNVLAKLADARIEVVDVGVASEDPPPDKVRNRRIAQGTRDITVEPAMTLNQLQKAFDVADHFVEQAHFRGARMLIAGEMGIGNTTAAACLICALTGADPVEVVGRGTGIDDGRYEQKLAMVTTALARVKAAHATLSPSRALAELSGFELATIAGFYVSAARRGMPVILDGYLSAAAALASVALDPESREWMLASHLSTETGHAVALRALNLEPLLDLKMRLGEGSGAVLALSVVRAALAVHKDMATFAEAGIAGPAPAIEQPAPGMKPEAVDVTPPVVAAAALAEVALTDASTQKAADEYPPIEAYMPIEEYVSFEMESPPAPEAPVSEAPASEEIVRAFPPSPEPETIEFAPPPADAPEPIAAVEALAPAAAAEAPELAATPPPLDLAPPTPEPVPPVDLESTQDVDMSAILAKQLGVEFEVEAPAPAAQPEAETAHAFEVAEAPALAPAEAEGEMLIEAAAPVPAGAAEIPVEIAAFDPAEATVEITGPAPAAVADEPVAATAPAVEPLIEVAAPAPIELEPIELGEIAVELVVPAPAASTETPIEIIGLAPAPVAETPIEITAFAPAVAAEPIELSAFAPPPAEKVEAPALAPAESTSNPIEAAPSAAFEVAIESIESIEFDAPAPAETAHKPTEASLPAPVAAPVADSAPIEIDVFVPVEAPKAVEAPKPVAAVPPPAPKDPKRPVRVEIGARLKQQAANKTPVAVVIAPTAVPLLMDVSAQTPDAERKKAEQSKDAVAPMEAGAPMDTGKLTKVPPLSKDEVFAPFELPTQAEVAARIEAAKRAAITHPLKDTPRSAAHLPKRTSTPSEEVARIAEASPGKDSAQMPDTTLGTEPMLFSETASGKWTALTQEKALAREALRTKEKSRGKESGRSKESAPGNVASTPNIPPVKPATAKTPVSPQEAARLEAAALIEAFVLDDLPATPLEEALAKVAKSGESLDTPAVAPPVEAAKPATAATAEAAPRVAPKDTLVPPSAVESELFEMEIDVESLGVELSAPAVAAALESAEAGTPEREAAQDDDEDMWFIEPSDIAGKK